MQRGHNHRALDVDQGVTLNPGANALKRSQMQTYCYGGYSRAYATLVGNFQGLARLRRARLLRFALSQLRRPSPLDCDP